MAIWNIDTGILFSALGLVATIALFMFKTIGSKNEKMIVHGEAIKRHEENICNNQKAIESITKDLAEMKINLLNLTAKVTVFNENMASLLASNQLTVTKINQHDIDIISFKKDIEYIKIESVHDRKESEYLRNKLEKMIEGFEDRNKRKEKVT